MSDKENTSWQELLIELVRASPCLYDKSHPDFFDDRGTKAHCWKRIAEQLKEAGYDNIKGEPTGGYNKLFLHKNTIFEFLIILLHFVNFFYLYWHFLSITIVFAMLSSSVVTTITITVQNLTKY